MSALAVDVALVRGDMPIEARFEAKAGVTALFGRSGAGKTSVLHAIAGLLRPGRGSVRLGTRALYDSARGIDVPVHRRRIGLVFQDARLLPHLSVRNNLLYGYRLASKITRRIGMGQVVELLGLEHLLERPPGSLSGGERQRAAIGRALLANPELLLMDEPLASLDGPRRGEILRYIERLRDELRVPIVYVSHSIEEVVRLADDAVLMERGRVIDRGSPQQVLDRPELQSSQVGIEAGATLEARVDGHDAAYELTTLGFVGGTLRVPRIDVAPGRRVRVRIRARDVAIALSRPADSSVLNVLPGTITSLTAEPGGTVEVGVRVGDGVLYARITRLSCERLKLHAGQAVHALIKSVSLDPAGTGFG